MGDPAQGLPVNAGPLEQPVPVYIRSVLADRLWQGEILQNVVQLKPLIESLQGAPGEIEMQPVIHELAIVMSPDCDLDRDFTRRQTGNQATQPNVLLCDVYPAAALRARVNQEEGFGGREWRTIGKNQNERFQYLQRFEVEQDLQAEGLPALAIDFRLCFTLPTDELYFRLGQDTRRRGRLNTPYVEHLTHRFFRFQGRVALPVDHVIDGAQPG